MDQTVMQGNKRKTTETADLTMGEGSSKRRHLNNSQNAELVNDNEYDIAALDADQVNVEEISPSLLVPAGKRVKSSMPYWGLCLNYCLVSIAEQL